MWRSIGCGKGYARVSAWLGRMLPALLCLAAVMTAAPPGATGAPTSFLGMTADLPDSAAGWSRRDEPEGIRLQKKLPRDAAAGRDVPGGLVLLISKVAPASAGKFEANIETALTYMPELADIDNRMSRSTGITVNGHPMRIEWRCCGNLKGVRVRGVHVAIDAGDAQAFLYFVMINVPPEVQKPFEAEFQAFVRSLRIGPNDKAFTLAPPADGGGLEGAFTHLNVGVRANGLGGLESYYDNQIRLFDASGLYSRALPTDTADVKSHCQAKPEDCGIYRLTGRGMLSGPKIEMTEVRNAYGLLERNSYPFEEKGTDLRINKGDYIRVAPMAAGERLEGEWRYSYAASSMTTSSFGSVAVERVLTLNRDGGFARVGWSNVAASNEIGNTRTNVNTSASRPIEKGRYTLDGYRLVLTGDDGRAESLSIFRPEKGSDALLVINGANYRKHGAEKRR